MQAKTRRPRQIKKATFDLSQNVLAQLDEVVRLGMANSKNELVERAIAKELKETRRAARAAEWARAAADPLFLSDIEQVASDFRYADAEITEPRR
jgi:hypothetical protein